jgi:hypothetical protein
MTAFVWARAPVLFLPVGIQHCGDITRRWSRGIRNRGPPNDNGREARLDLLVLFARRNEAGEQDMPLGNEVLVKEAELDQAFAGGRIDDAGLHRILADIGLLQGELRYTHLKYHLAMRGVLSPDQIAVYDRLRGYNSAQAPAPGMHGRQSQ